MFHREFGNLLTGILGNIEISFRTYIAYTLATKYGTCGYIDRNNFNDTATAIQFVNDII